MDERVLVLDDEPSVLDVLSQLLKQLGRPCDVTESAFEALGWLETQRYALLITDIRMPEMNGIDVVERAKALDEELAIIIITAYADVSDAVQALRSGADDYVLKPFNLNELSLAVSRVIEKRREVLASREYQDALEQRVRTATEDLERVNKELQETKQYLENLLHSTVDAILTLDPSGHVEFVNDGALKMLGYSRDAFIGMDSGRIFRDGREEVTKLWKQVDGKTPLQNYETEFRRRDGAMTPVSMSVSIVRGRRSERVSLLAICKDITEQRRLENELRELSIKDSLTGLYNQRHFHERLRNEIERAKRQKHPLSLLLFDIDQFKQYNDRHGHLAGDKVLQAVGRVVMESTRDHVDIGFRYGGDEFTVILPEAGQAQALQIAERIRRTFEDRGFDGLTLSIGLMAYQEGYSVPMFIQFTDAMMYDAKRAGGNSVYVYHPGRGLEEVGREE